MTEQLYRELRYPAMVFPERTPEQREAMIAEVDAAFVRTFGDGKSSPADGFIVGGMGWIAHNEHEMDRRAPQDCPAWNEKIEKARRDIAELEAEQRLRRVAELITEQEIIQEIEVIRTWAKSLLSA